MSGNWTVKNLEEIFLSQEFAGAGAGASRVQLEGSDGRSILTPTFGQVHRLHSVQPLDPVDPHHLSSGDPEERKSTPYEQAPCHSARLRSTDDRRPPTRHRRHRGRGRGRPRGGGRDVGGSARTRLGSQLAGARPRGAPGQPHAAARRLTAVPQRCAEGCAGFAGRTRRARQRPVRRTRRRECTARSPSSTAPRRATRRRRERVGCHLVARRWLLRCRRYRRRPRPTR